nr:HAMP domain-containing sensor histidine kinase [Hymenobacter qilianensis]
MSGHLRAVSRRGGELGYTILEDISARKGLEAQLQRLYDAQETILQLATHDIKAPIAQIELLTDLLQREVASRAGEGPPPPEMVHYLGLIQRACTHATGLLEDVLYVGDLDEHDLEKQATDLNAYLTARLEGHRPAADEQGVMLALDLPAEPVYGRLHPDKFGRVLDNLLGNALKFTPTGGPSRWGTGARGPRAPHGAGHGHWHSRQAAHPPVRQVQPDAAQGPARGAHHRLRPLHCQADRAAARGDIWLESREQQGTTFFIELP